MATPSKPVRVPRLDIDWDVLVDQRLVRIPDVLDAIEGRGRIAGFPALGVLNFGLGRPSPWRHDYFFPGRPDSEEEAALAREITHDPPDAVVMLDSPSGPFAAAFAAHPALVGAIEGRMVELRQIGPYRVLIPRAP